MAKGRPKKIPIITFGSSTGTGDKILERTGASTAEIMPTSNETKTEEDGNELQKGSGKQNKVGSA